MRKALAALTLVVAALAIGEGCAPVPLPHYAAYGPRRVEELLVDSENLRLGGDDWERFWFLDQPSHLTPSGPTAASVPDRDPRPPRHDPIEHRRPVPGSPGYRPFSSRPLRGLAERPSPLAGQITAGTGRGGGARPRRAVGRGGGGGSALDGFISPSG